MQYKYNIKYYKIETTRRFWCYIAFWSVTSEKSLFVRKSWSLSVTSVPFLRRNRIQSFLMAAKLKEHESGQKNSFVFYIICKCMRICVDFAIRPCSIHKNIIANHVHYYEPKSTRLLPESSISNLGHKGDASGVHS